LGLRDSHSIWTTFWGAGQRDLPLTIQPGETVAPEVMVYFFQQPGVFYRHGLFYTDAPDQPEVPFWITGRTVDKDK
jgi:hypothetical protein